MSSIEYTNRPGEGEKRRVIWTDTNWIGLHQAWVDELVADGYELIDRRTKSPSPQEAQADKAGKNIGKLQRMW